MHSSLPVVPPVYSDDHYVLQLHPEGNRRLAYRGEGYVGAHQDHYGSSLAEGVADF